CSTMPRSIARVLRNGDIPDFLANGDSPGDGGSAGERVRRSEPSRPQSRFRNFLGRKFLAFARRSLRDFQAQAPLLNAAEAAASVSADCTRGLEPSDPLARAATVRALSPLARNRGGKTSSFDDIAMPHFLCSPHIREPVIASWCAATACGGGGDGVRRRGGECEFERRSARRSARRYSLVVQTS